MPGTLAHYDTRRSPDDLRFTKGTINLDFPGQVHCETIYDVLYELETRKLTPRDLPSLRVISHGGQLWTLDNKLLYIYRISPKVKQVSVVHVSNGWRFLDKFLAENSTRDIERMASPEFFPKVDNRDKSSTAELCLYRADCVQIFTVKNIMKMKEIRRKRSSTSKLSSSARSVSSSKTVTTRISSGNAETGVPPSLSVKSKCAHSDSKTSRSRRASSSDSGGFSSASEDTVDLNRYPAVRTMTGHLLLHSEDSLRISTADEGNENARARRRRFSFPSFAERPSTCHAYSKFSCSRFPSATRAARLEKPSSEAFTILEPLAAFPGSRGHFFPSRFSATFPDKSPENVSRYVSAKLRENSRENDVSQSLFANLQDDSQENVSLSFSAKFHDNSRENVSQSFSSHVEIGEDELRDDFELEGFVLPDFGYPLPKTADIKCDDDDISSSSSQKPNGSQISSARDRLDRSVSSCSSSTERPMKKPHGGEPRRSGSVGGPHMASALLQRSSIARSGSPLRRASVSVGRTMQCHLSAEHEFEVSKQILLKHMKKAFFSVC